MLGESFFSPLTSMFSSVSLFSHVLSVIQLCATDMCVCVCVAPLSHTIDNLILTSFCNIQYLFHVLCLHDIELSGSFNVRALMGDYRCCPLMPLTHQHRTCSAQKYSVYAFFLKSNLSLSRPQHNIIKRTVQKLTWKLSVGAIGECWDCMMTGPRSVVQQLYIAQHGRQEIDI